MKESHAWLENGKQYRFKTYVVTQSEDANMLDEMIGDSNEIEVTYFDTIPGMNPISLVAGDSGMTISWDALTNFAVPVENLRYQVFMNGGSIGYDLIVTELFKSSSRHLINGELNDLINGEWRDARATNQIKL
jgi:hypothetical protein